MVHTIILKHTDDDNDQIIYNNLQGSSVSIQVHPNDELVFNAEGADWRLTIIVADGDFDHTDILIKQNNKITIKVSSAPKSLAIFEAVCQLCPPSPTEAPKRIIITSVRIGTPQIESAIKKQIDRINSLKIF